MLSEKDRVLLSESKGLRFRVNMACKDCTYDPNDTGNWRQQVGNCTVTLCPLYPVRPRSSGK